MSTQIETARVVEAVTSVRTKLRGMGRPDVKIVAVTKSFGIDAVRAAHAAGCDAVGENYAQELVAKIREAEVDAAGMPPIPVHFIGHLQTNKVRQLVPYISVWQTIDRKSVIDEIARRTTGGAHVLIQVNSTSESSKDGCDPRDVDALVAHARGRGLDVRGLMTIGPTLGSEKAAATAFQLVRALADAHGLEECSMGMSNDYPVAVECGSTMIRLGSVLFGPRNASVSAPPAGAQGELA